ncbi:MAG: hypothetical protein CME64_08315 [Halobacteriovoraceae bacterium]|nr:hypothetical protein [Halobacteriovoraceae bacterium]
MKSVSVILLLAFAIGNANAQNNRQLINWFAGADIVGTANSESELPSDAMVREFELSANAHIDHIWEGTLTLSKHREPGQEDDPPAEVHEAFVFSNSIVEQGHLKLGKFFLGVGRLNRFHRHDWAFTNAPYYHEQFFGTEGVKDTGVEYSKLLSTERYINLTLGLTNGREFVHSHDHEHEEETSEHGAAHVPTHYARLSSFKEFSTTEGLEYGLNYIGRTDSEGIKYSYAGVDFVYKNRVRRFVDTLAQFELWQRSTTHDSENHKDLGAYLYLEKGMNQNHSFGFRLDYFKPDSEEHDEEESHDHEHGLEVENELYTAGFSYIYTNSEFLKTRFTVSRSEGFVVEEEEVGNTKASLQLVFSIGAHPAHLY